MIKLHIVLCCNFTFLSVRFSVYLLSQCHATALVRLRHKNNLVIVRKSSRFGLKYCVKTTLNCSRAKVI